MVKARTWAAMTVAAVGLLGACGQAPTPSSPAGEEGRPLVREQLEPREALAGIPLPLPEEFVAALSDCTLPATDTALELSCHVDPAKVRDDLHFSQLDFSPFDIYYTSYPETSAGLAGASVYQWGEGDRPEIVLLYFRDGEMIADPNAATMVTVEISYQDSPYYLVYNDFEEAGEGEAARWATVVTFLQDLGFFPPPA